MYYSVGKLACLSGV